VCEKVDESLSIALEAFHVWSVEDWFAVPFRATLTPAENNCISNMFMYWPVVDSTFIFLAFTEHVTVEGAAVTGDVVGEGLDMEVGGLEVGVIVDGELDELAVVGFNVGEALGGIVSAQDDKSKSNSSWLHVSPKDSVLTTTSFSSRSSIVAFDSRQRQAGASFTSWQYRLTTVR